MQFSKFIVVFVILINIVFAGVVLYIFAKTGNEPQVLTGVWFAFTTGELWGLSKIKRDQIKKDTTSKEE